MVPSRRPNVDTERGPSAAMVRSASPMTEQACHVIVSQLGETPIQALESYVSLQPQPRPSADALGPHEVVYDGVGGEVSAESLRRLSRVRRR